MNADPPDGFVPSDPGLDRLLGMLTAGPTPDELTGESAALAMFRANHRSASAGPSRPAPGFYARRAARLAAAVTVVLAGAFAGAAYDAVLPAPVQHVAYRVLGFAGVPDISRSRPPSGRPQLGRSAPPSASPTPSPLRSIGHTSPPTPRPSASSSGAAPGPGSLTLTVQHSQIVAGAGEVFTGRLTRRGQFIRSATLSLLERTAGRPGWHLAARGTTGARGRAVLVTADLTANAAFQLTGPDGAQSKPVLVIVLPSVSARLAVGPHRHADVLTASSPLADPGDAVVLQIWYRGAWLSVREHRLHRGGQAAFLIRPRPRSRVYRIVLLATVTHGRGASNPLTVPPR